MFRITKWCTLVLWGYRFSTFYGSCLVFYSSPWLPHPKPATTCVFTDTVYMTLWVDDVSLAVHRWVVLVHPSGLSTIRCALKIRMCVCKVSGTLFLLFVTRVHALDKHWPGLQSLVCALPCVCSYPLTSDFGYWNWEVVRRLFQHILWICSWVFILIVLFSCLRWTSLATKVLRSLIGYLRCLIAGGSPDFDLRIVVKPIWNCFFLLFNIFGVLGGHLLAVYSVKP